MLVHGRLTPGHMRWQCQLNFKTWGDLPWTSVCHNLRHPMHLNHMIPPSYRWWFPTLSKEMLCHDSYRPRGHTFPSGRVTHSYITLVVRYVQSTACLHCAVLLKLWCSTVDLSQCCFTVWPLPKPVTLHEIVYFIPHYEFRELYSDFPGTHPDPTDFYNFSELMFRNSYPKLFMHSVRIPLWCHTTNLRLTQINNFRKAEA